MPSSRVASIVGFCVCEVEGHRVVVLELCVPVYLLCVSESCRSE